MDIARLKAEIVNDPLGIGYTGDDAAVAAKLNAATIPGVRVLHGTELLAWAGSGASDTVDSRELRLRQAAAGTIPATDQQLRQAGVPRKAVQGAASVAVGIVGAPGDTRLDLSLPSRRQLLGALVVGQVLAQAESDELYALSQGSRAEQLGLGTVEAKHIRWARL